MTAATIVTVKVTECCRFAGFEVGTRPVISVAFPVIVTVNVAVVVAVPLKVIRTPALLPPGLVPPTQPAAEPKHGAVLLKATFKVPDPEFRTEVAFRFTGPANAAALTPAAEPEGRLPTLIVPVAEAPELKLEGLPLTIVMLKSWGLIRMVTGWVLVCIAVKTPFTGIVPVGVTVTVYVPEAVVGRRRPPAKVSVTVPDAPGTDVALRVAVRTGTVAGSTAPLARVTVPV